MIKNLFLENEEANIYVVDWERPAAADYWQAASNLRVVAAQAEVVLQQFVSEGLSLDKVHIVGHSLGAHLAGKIGQRLGGQIGRITGLDPASPLFEGQDAGVRLDETDAVFVDAIHTDGISAGNPGAIYRMMYGGFGMFERAGHLDVYVNGGESQPGCTDGMMFRDLTKLLDGSVFQTYCSHLRVFDLFIESLNSSSSCPFTTYQCDSNEVFQTGQCLGCQNTSSCNMLGYHGDASGGLGNVYVNTYSESPFCGVHYGVTLHQLKDLSGSRTETIVGTKVSDGSWQMVINAD